MNALFLAFAYLRYHWQRSFVLIAVISLMIVVPVSTQILLSASERQLTLRAEQTPMLLGSRGSRLDLTMSALYFADSTPDPVTMTAVEAVWDSGLALPVPLHAGFSTEGRRIVGTTLDYFDFRALQVAEGRQIALLGDAVIGADVARDLGKGPGDTLVSSPENLFDLDGVYPLEMPIVGVLARQNSPDDAAVFVDIKTAWVIAGIGHGHDDVVLAEGDSTAPAGLMEYRQITPETIDSFHFHGDPDSFPLSAVLVVPNDARSATILRGRYLDPEGPVQIVVPETVVQGLVDQIFRIKGLLDAVTGIIGLAAFAAISLAVYLTYRLRDDEMHTAVRLGAGRGMVLRLLFGETLILLAGAGIIAAGLVALVTLRSDNVVNWIIAFGS